MLQPLHSQHEGRNVRLACVHWKHWPPIDAYDGAPVETLRRQGRLSDELYAQYLIWQRVCGLLKMDEAKCLTCPHIRLAEIRNYLPCLVTLDGKLVVPLADRDGEKLARGYLVAAIKDRK